MNPDLGTLEATCNELATAVHSLVRQCRHVDAGATDLLGGGGAVPQPLVPPKAPGDALHTRRHIMVMITRLQLLFAEPADMLQQLAMQNQLLACLHWLCDFQVLACIPLSGSVAIADLADLASVPELQLSSVVRMMATASFLREPEAGHIAHSALSAAFAAQPSYLDATLFLAQAAAPAALHMPAATRRFGQSRHPNETAYSVAFNTPSTFASACEQQPKLQRQWPAYLRYALGEDTRSYSTDVLSSFDWPSLGEAVVVEVGARSAATAISLAERHPALHLVVQPSDPIFNGHFNRLSISGINGTTFSKTSSNGRASTPSSRPVDIPPHLNTRITVDYRGPGALQNVHGAAVYIIRVPWPPNFGSQPAASHVLSELRAHVGVLRASPHARLLVMASPVPEPASIEPTVGSATRLRDLTLLQLANERNISAGELMDILNSISDVSGRLVLVNKIRSRNSANAVLEVKFQLYVDPAEQSFVAPIATVLP